MGLATGGIISFGGGAGTGGAGSSGIQSINNQTGSAITINGANGAQVLVTGTNILTVDVAPLSGIIPATSGIESINGDSGPHIDLIGVNGVNVSSLGNGDVLIDGAGASGAGGGGSVNKFAADFVDTASGQVSHSLGSRDVVVSVRINDSTGRPREVTPDDIIFDTPDFLSVLFNTPQTFRVVVVG